MAISTYSGDADYISQLHDKPITDDGLTSAQFKAKFDQFGSEFKAWFNGTFIPACNNTFQTILGSGNKLNGAYITDGTVTATQIADTTITGSKMVNKTVTATQIADATITNAKVANTTLTEAKMANINSSGHLWKVYITNTAPTSSSAEGIYLVY